MSKTVYPSSDLYEMNRSIMVVGAHADDIEAHAGGTVAKYHARGYEIVYVMSTNNMSGSANVLDGDGTVRTVALEPPVLMMARRKRECDIAAAALGTKPIHLDHPQRHYNGDNGRQEKLHYGCVMPTGVACEVPSILTACEDSVSIQTLADLIIEKDPECVLTHGVCQVNIEHFATALLTTKAYWNAVDAGYKGALLQWREAHHCHGEHNMRWDTFVDYTPYLDRKMELIGMHACQMPHWQQPTFGHRVRAMEFGRACGCEAAEPFTWVRRIDHRGDCQPPYGSLTLELIRNSR